MIYFVFGVLGAAMGSVYLYGQGGFLFGGLVGLLLGAAVAQRNRLQAMEQRLKALEAELGRPAAGAAPGQASAVVRKPDAEDKKGAHSEERTEAPAAPAAPPATTAASTPTADIPSLELELADPLIEGDGDGADAAPQPEHQPPSLPAHGNHPIRQWLLGGNIVVRIGIVVLLFGFGFLLKYAASRDLVPLEVRLGAAFIAGIGLLLLGWRLRSRRFAYAITLQGGGIGVMYLVLFAAARLFHLVPIPFVLGLMVGLVTFSGALAVLQNAAAMAVVGAAGGFMAPVLLSTGSGSHIMLFSYYALLNAGIFGIAWFKAWRWLNLLGFGFTFGIGSAWGLQYYRPAYFASTEPFLVLFFLFYLTIAVLFALRQPPRLKGYVDGTLVFGLPLVVFSLQAGLVTAMPYGLAFSALAMGMIYAGLATALWQRGEEGLRTLVEAFLALAVIFGSLAIPLALSGNWTAVTWSLEGAGLVWIGLRQRRWTPRAFGLLLQAGSGVLFVIHGSGGAEPMPVVNSRFLGGMVIGLAGLFCAFMLERHRERLHALERRLAPPVMAWGLAWWFATGINEVDRIFSRRHEWPAGLVFIGASALLMGAGYRRLNWKGIRIPALGLLPAMVLACAAIASQYDLRHPFQGWWAVVWPALIAVHGYLLYVMDTAWPPRLGVAWHTVGALLATVLVSWEAGWLMKRIAGSAGVWELIAWGGVPAIVLWGASRFGGRVKGLSAAWDTARQTWLPAALAAGLGAWSLLGMFSDGNPRPLSYLPMLNPLDLVQAFVLLVVSNHMVDAGRKKVLLPLGITSTGWWAGTAVGVLGWLTAVVARTVHAFGSVPYDWGILLRSDLFHAAIAVLWGVMALGSMVAANRLHRRPIWFCGAGLLAVVVVKLFLVDLSGSGTISRIVSFLAVGMLMLVIGFFTPLPPQPSKGSRSC